MAPTFFEIDMIHNQLSGQITIIPKPELRAFWEDSLTKPRIGETSAGVVIIHANTWTIMNHHSNRTPFIPPHLYGCFSSSDSGSSQSKDKDGAMRRSHLDVGGGTNVFRDQKTGDSWIHIIRGICNDMSLIVIVYIYVDTFIIIYIYIERERYESTNKQTTKKIG